MTVFRNSGDLDGRTRKLLDSALIPGEEFVLGVTCDDGLLERWATRLVITNQRVLALRKVGLETKIRGFKHGRIGDVGTDPSRPARLVIERETEDVEYDLAGPEERRTFVETLKRQLGRR